MKVGYKNYFVNYLKGKDQACYSYNKLSIVLFVLLKVLVLPRILISLRLYKVYESNMETVDWQKCSIFLRKEHPTER